LSREFLTASYDQWLEVFQLAYRAPQLVSELACPNCDARELHLRFLLYEDQGHEANAVFWCGSCLEGMAPGPSEVPGGCTPVRREDAGVPNYRIVPPAGLTEHALRKLGPMTYFADLSDYSYSPSVEEKMLNVGWLGRGKAFEPGGMDEGIWDEPVGLASEPVNVILTCRLKSSSKRSGLSGSVVWRTPPPLDSRRRRAGEDGNG
jgi:hypothetical protein